MLARVVVSFACVLMMHLRPEQAGREAASPTGSTLLRHDIREMIRPRCGSCHTLSRPTAKPTAKPTALAVFDLTHDDWSATISIKQCEAFTKRLSSLRDDQRTLVQRFVKEEIEHRRQEGR